MQSWQGPVKVGACVLAAGALVALWQPFPDNPYVRLALAAGVAIAAVVAARWAQNAGDAAPAGSGMRAASELAQHANDIVLISDGNGNILDANDRAVAAYGYSREELIGRSVRSLRATGHDTDFEQRWQQTGQSEGAVFETVHQRKDGSAFPVEVSGRITVVDGRPLHTGIVRDIADRASAEKKIRDARNYFESILNALACPVLVKDRQHRFVLINDAACAFFGHARKDILGKNDYDLVPREEADVFHEKDELVFNSRRENLNEETITDAKGNRFTILTRKAVFQDAAGMDVLVAIINDITKLKEVEEKHRHQAQHDFLTGLPNRMLFEDRLRQALLRGDRVGNRAAVMMMDLDRFKRANDEYGHGVGDQLLKLVAERLGGCVRKMDTVCRFGGDEFSILLTDVTSRDDAASVATKILQAVSRPFSIEGHDIGIGVSIGISLYPQDAADHPSLLKHADQALYEVKASGRNNFRFFTAS